MQKIAIAIAVLLVAGERAEACPDAAWIPDEVGYAFGLAIAGGYAGGIAYFGDHDLANDRNDRDYVTGDIAFNGLFTALWATGTVSALEEHSGYAVPLAGLTALHGAMLVDAPLAAGAAYLAYRAANDGNGARAMIYTGMAGVSGALAVHGIATAISPYHAPALDLLGTDVTPTIVDDGREMGPGLGAGGTF